MSNHSSDPPQQHDLQQLQQRQQHDDSSQTNQTRQQTPADIDVFDVLLDELDRIPTNNLMAASTNTDEATQLDAAMFTRCILAARDDIRRARHKLNRAMDITDKFDRR